MSGADDEPALICYIMQLSLTNHEVVYALAPAYPDAPSNP
jgi:hypothetical protein